MLIYLRDVNVRGYNKRIVLSYTVNSNNLILISYLLERGIDISLIDIKGRLSLLYLTDGENCFSIYNRFISVSVNLDYEDNDNNTIMLRYAIISNIRAIRVLLN